MSVGACQGEDIGGEASPRLELTKRLFQLHLLLRPPLR